MQENWNLCWHSQIEDVLEIHDFKYIVDGGHPAPPKSLSDDSVNPDYNKQKFYKLILSWIKASGSFLFYDLLFPCSSMFEAWSLLDKRLSLPCVSCILSGHMPSHQHIF